MKMPTNLSGKGKKMKKRELKTLLEAAESFYDQIFTSFQDIEVILGQSYITADIAAIVWNRAYYEYKEKAQIKPTKISADRMKRTIIHSM